MHAPHRLKYIGRHLPKVSNNGSQHLVCFGCHSFPPRFGCRFFFASHNHCCNRLLMQEHHTPNQSKARFLQDQTQHHCSQSNSGLALPTHLMSHCSSSGQMQAVPVLQRWVTRCRPALSNLHPNSQSPALSSLFMGGASDRHNTESPRSAQRGELKDYSVMPAWGLIFLLCYRGRPHPAACVWLWLICQAGYSMEMKKWIANYS